MFMLYVLFWLSRQQIFTLKANTNKMERTDWQVEFFTLEEIAAKEMQRRNVAA